VDGDAGSKGQLMRFETPSRAVALHAVVMTASCTPEQVEYCCFSRPSVRLREAGRGVEVRVHRAIVRTPLTSALRNLNSTHSIDRIKGIVKRLPLVEAAQKLRYQRAFAGIVTAASRGCMRVSSGKHVPIYSGLYFRLDG
jgi:hypothetical protein